VVEDVSVREPGGTGQTGATTSAGAGCGSCACPRRTRACPATTSAGGRSCSRALSTATSAAFTCARCRTAKWLAHACSYAERSGCARRGLLDVDRTTAFAANTSRTSSCASNGARRDVSARSARAFGDRSCHGSVVCSLVGTAACSFTPRRSATRATHQRRERAPLV
jgi:hypothetical protein